VLPLPLEDNAIEIATTNACGKEAPSKRLTKEEKQE